MSVIQTVEMVEIRFMNKRVSPTGQRGTKKKGTISGRSGEIPTARKIYSHGIHESAKSEERSGADQHESYRLGVHKDIDALCHCGERASRPSLLLATVSMFHGNDADARGPIDNRIYLPMRAKSEKDGGEIPPSTQGAEKGEKDQECQHGLRRPSGGDTDHNGVQKVEGNQEGRTPCVVLRYGCRCCVFAVVV